MTNSLRPNDPLIKGQITEKLCIYKDIFFFTDPRIFKLRYILLENQTICIQQNSTDAATAVSELSTTVLHY